MSHHVYLVEYLGAPRNHHAIFIETDDNQSGYLYHVKGTIQDGMTYEVKHRSNPEQSTTFAKKTYLGWVNEPDYSRVNDICAGVSPTKEQFNKGRRLDRREPLRRCQEWTQDAIQALRDGGVLQTQDEVAEEYWVWSPEHNDHYHVDSDGTYQWASYGL